MQFLGELDGALNPQKIRGHLITTTTHTQKRRFVSPLNIRIQGETTDIMGTFSACYVTQKVTWLQNARGELSERREKNFNADTKKNIAARRVEVSARDGKGCIIDLLYI